LTLEVDISSLKENIKQNKEILKDLQPFVIKQYDKWAI
jgi:hypothetical protein